MFPSPTRPELPTPALATTMSQRPSLSAASASAAATSASSVTSSWRTSTLRSGSLLAMALRTSSSASSLRAVRNRSYPRPASSSASALPIPELAPVMKTVLATGGGRYMAQRTASAAARPAIRPENRQPPRNVPSSER